MYRRIVAVDYGLPEVLQLVEDPIPQPATGQVLIRVLAAGVARGEVLRRQAPVPGFPPPPYTPGYDVAGIVEKVGADVDASWQGKHVVAFALSPDFTMGGYAEYVVLPEGRLVEMPSDLDPVEVVALVVNYITAFQLMHRGGEVETGQRVLIHGASGGVGTALLQLGRLAGLEMYGTASAANHDLVRDLGGISIDYKTEDFVEQIREWTDDGVDVVFDGIGMDYVDRSYRILRPGGKLLVYGFTAMNPADFMDQLMPEIERINGMNELDPDKSVMVYGIDIDDKADWYREDLKSLVKLLADGKIKPIIADRLPLDQAAEAHRRLEAGGVAGKIVLDLTQ